MPAAFVHGSASIRVIPGTSHLIPAGLHLTGARLQIVPGTIQLNPAFAGSSAAFQVVPGAVFQIPAAASHISAGIKAVQSSSDTLPAIFRVSAIFMLIPPAVAILHPLLRHRLVGLGNLSVCSQHIAGSVLIHCSIFPEGSVRVQIIGTAVNLADTGHCGRICRGSPSHAVRAGLICAVIPAGSVFIGLPAGLGNAFLQQEFSAANLIPSVRRYSRFCKLSVLHIILQPGSCLLP